MRMLATALLLTWIASIVAGGVICYLILYPPSRFGRAVIATMVGASVVAAVLTLTAPPLGGVELYRYLTHGVQASVGEIRSGLTILGRLALRVGGEQPAAAAVTSRAAPVAADALPDEQPAPAAPDHAALAPHPTIAPVQPESPTHDGRPPRAPRGGRDDRQDLRGLVPASLVDGGSTRRRHGDRRGVIHPVPRSDRSERILNSIEISSVPVSDADERGEKFPRTDKLLGTDGPDRDKGNRADKPEKGEKPEKAEKADMPDKPEKADKPEKIEKVDKVEKVETVDKPEKVEKVERVARVDRIEKVEKVERPTRIDRPTRPERIERPDRRGR
ncbi:MAG TPA: hypothetical protein VHT71_00430 [Methylomirabilota bacterium]|nr:hypothetical protein [Methylomirabilota bacterium]